MRVEQHSKAHGLAGGQIYTDHWQRLKKQNNLSLFGTA